MLNRRILTTGSYTIAGVALLGVLAAIGIAYGAAPGPHGGAGSTKSRGSTTLRFDEKGTYFKLVDNPPANTTQNPETGDTILFRSKLVSGDRKIGTDQGYCVLVDPPRATCAVTLFLRSGHLVFVDGFPFGTGKPYDFTMAGGTGAYRGVHGQAVIRQLGSTHFRWVVKIRR
jgi:hypothetical protein